MKHDELNETFTFVAYSRSIKDTFDTDDPNSIQSVTGHASYTDEKGTQLSFL